VRHRGLRLKRGRGFCVASGTTVFTIRVSMCYSCVIIPSMYEGVCAMPRYDS
jgi:hypothetical protein